MACSRSVTQEWVTKLNVSGVEQKYAVKLVAHKNCCQSLATIQIFVNDTEIPHELIDSMCSPMCGSTGRYQWQISGHYFLLVANNLTWWWKRYQLFVDGIDVQSGLEYTAFWRRRGWCYFIIGAVLAVLGAVGLFLCLYFEYYQDAGIRPVGTILVIGIVFLIFGLIIILKHRKPLVYENIGFREPFSSFSGNSPQMITA